MDREQVKKVIIDHIKENLYVKFEPTEDMSFYNDLETDSLDFIETIMNAENELGITIGDKEIDSLEMETNNDFTVGQLIDLVYDIAKK